MSGSTLSGDISDDFLIWETLEIIKVDDDHEPDEEVRCGHGSFLNNHGEIVVLGGKNRKNFDLTKLTLTSEKGGRSVGLMRNPILASTRKREEERFAFCGVFCRQEDYFFMHGGFDSEFNHSGSRFITRNEGGSFTVRSLKNEEEESGCGPSPRGYHSAAYVESESRVIIFGGQCCLGGPYTFYNDLHSLHLPTLTWTRLDCSGDEAPSPRSQCFCFIYKRGFFVYGGYDGKNIFTDLHRLDLDTLTWSKVMTEGAGSDRPLGLRGLSPLDFHIYFCRPAGAVIGRRLVILTEQYETGKSAVFTLDMRSLKWRRLFGRHPDQYRQRHKMKFVWPSFDPPARGNPTLTQYGDRLIMIGGHARNAGLEDGHIWSIALPKTMDWKCERLLWLACYKNNRAECLLANCPPHVIYKIIGYINANSFYFN